MARCAAVRTGCYGPRALHTDARFGRHSRFESRVPVQALRMLLLHFSSLKLLTQPYFSLKSLHRSAKRHKSVRRNSGNDRGVRQSHRGDIFRVGQYCASDDSQRFRNLDILVFRPCSMPLASHLRSRVRAQAATPSDFARSRVLRGGCGRVLVRRFDRTPF
jgi:hypothetical protein